MQGRSGLGLEAQRAAVHAHLAGAGGTLIAEITEVQSGAKNEVARQGLGRALALCKRQAATLLIAKLDRLARNVALIARLMESKVAFVAADMPHANPLTLHIIAAMAQYERELFSQRMAAATRARVARGCKQGFQHMSKERLREVTHKGGQAARARCLAAAEQILPLIRQMRALGIRSFKALAKGLNARGEPTPIRGRRWHAAALARTLELADPDIRKRLRLGGISPRDRHFFAMRAGVRNARRARAHAAIILAELAAHPELKTKVAMAKHLNAHGLKTLWGNAWRPYRVGKLIAYGRRIAVEPLPPEPPPPVKLVFDDPIPALSEEQARIEAECAVIESQIDRLRQRQAAIRAGMMAGVV